jgi:hypothetical protein
MWSGKINMPSIFSDNDSWQIEMYGGPRDGERKTLDSLPDIIEAMLPQSIEAALHQPPVFVKAVYERTKRVTANGVVKYYFQREEVVTA